MPDRIELYEPRPMVTNALKRLGTRIASRAPLTREEQHLYEEFIGDAGDRTRGAQSFVQTAVGVLEQVFAGPAEFEVVGRVKTRNTLADKLERTPAEKLPSVHDVAGLRLVHPGGVLAQDLIVQALRDMFDLATVDIVGIDLEPIRGVVDPETPARLEALKERVRPLEQHRLEGVARIRRALDRVRRSLES